jgi:hypothetical protein
LNCRRIVLVALFCGAAAAGCQENDAARAQTDAARAADPDAQTLNAEASAVPFEPVFAIFQGACLPCHASTAEHPNPSAKLDLGSAQAAYALLINTSPQGSACMTRPTRLVVPFEPSQSLLLQKLQNAPELCGAPMPKPSAMQAFVSLPDDELAVIEAWIRSGALE